MASRTLSLKNKIGLVLAGLLGISDLTGPFTLPADGGQEGPPIEVLIAGSVLGLITLVAVGYTWRMGSRVGIRIVAGTRILSVLTALPAFFVPGVPPAVVALVGAVVVITIVAVVLVLSRPAPATQE